MMQSFSCKNLNVNIDTVNKGLDLIKNWFDSKKLTLNVDKTNCIIIKIVQNKFISSKEIKMHGMGTTEGNSITFLGITTDQ